MGGEDVVSDDLFHTDPEPDDQDAYRELLKAQYDRDIKTITGRGEIPPWVEADQLLDQDEFRLMTVISDAGGYVEGEKITVEYPDGRVRRVSKLTREAGFNAEVNCVAVVNRCISKGYILREQEPARSRLCITSEGRWRLDALEADEYWSGDDG